MNPYNIYSPPPRGMPPSLIWQRPRIPFYSTLYTRQGGYTITYVLFTIYKFSIYRGGGLGGEIHA